MSISGNTPNLINYWELNEGTGQVAIDKTNNANGELGSTSIADINDPTWVTDCCNSDSIINRNIDVVINDYVLYPNPARDYLIIKFDNPVSNLNISIFNTIGKEVLRVGLDNESSKKVDFKNLVSGVYYVLINIDGHNSFEKIIINR